MGFNSEFTEVLVHRELSGSSHAFKSETMHWVVQHGKVQLAHLLQSVKFAEVT